MMQGVFKGDFDMYLSAETLLKTGPLTKLGMLEGFISAIGKQNTT